MKEENIELGLALKHLNNFSLETFSDRLLLQKKIYCAQMLGIDFGFRYNWYLKGPYSPELTSLAYETIKGDEEILELYELNEDVTNILDKVNQISKHKLRKKLVLKETDWFELITSIHYLKNEAAWVKDKSMASIREALIREKPKYRKEHFEAGWAVLEEFGVI